MTDHDTRTSEQLLAEAARLADLAAERSRQLDLDDLKAMKPEAIEAARRRGQLTDLLNNNTNKGA